MESLQNKIHEKAMSDEKWKKIQQDVHESVSSFSIYEQLQISFFFSVILKLCVMFKHQVDVCLVNSHPSDSSSEELDALRGRYIRRVTAVIVYHIPAFWKVALSVSSGKFGKVKASCHYIKYRFILFIYDINNNFFKA